MNKVAVVLALTIACAAVAQGAKWAVLVAGSNTFSNYRHQADIAHAYNLLVNHGVPAANIITFMYDDLVNNTENPVKGKLFNHPTSKGVAGVDVYAGIKGKIDYSGKYVTPENFIAVLKGDAKNTTGGSGKVLKSTADDDVFINFSDHGGTDLLAFPSEYLYVQDLTAAIKYMFANKMYGKLVFYLEACESGSMFEGQGWEKLNAYGVSASLPDESSWGYYCGDSESGSDSVNGVEIGSCLGDLFSINWMEDCDKPTIATEILKQQFVIVYNETAVGTESGDFSSHPQQYGAISVYDPLLVVEFIGDKPVTRHHHTRVTPAAAAPIAKRTGGVPAADATLHSLYRRYSLAVKSGDLDRINLLSQMLQDEIALRTKLDNVFAGLTQKFGGAQAAELLANPATAYDKSEERSACYQDLVEAFSAPSACGRNDYNVKYMRVLSNLCAYAVDNDVATQTLVDEVVRVCV